MDFFEGGDLPPAFEVPQAASAGGGPEVAFS
jgi:hypothetical protein